VLSQNLPVVLYLYDSRKGIDRAVDEAISKAAKQYAGQFLVARIDVASNPQTYREYGNLTTPAIVTLLNEGTGRKVKSQAASVRPDDVQAHIDYVLGKAPAPKPPTTAPASANASKAAPQVVTDATFETEVLNSTVPVLVDFWAPWCGPCRMIAPVVEQVAKTYAGRARVAKVNVDENPMIAQRFQILSIPTLMVFKNGKPVKRQVGANPGIIPNMIEEVLR
jgi:thioredoxin 1